MFYTHITSWCLISQPCKVSQRLLRFFREVFIFINGISWQRKLSLKLFDWNRWEFTLKTFENVNSLNLLKKNEKVKFLTTYKQALYPKQHTLYRLFFSIIWIAINSLKFSKELFPKKRFIYGYIIHILWKIMVGSPTIVSAERLCSNLDI